MRLLWRSTKLLWGSKIAKVPDQVDLEEGSTMTLKAMPTSRRYWRKPAPMSTPNTLGLWWLMRRKMRKIKKKLVAKSSSSTLRHHMYSMMKKLKMKLKIKTTPGWSRIPLEACARSSKTQISYWRSILKIRWSNLRKICLLSQPLSVCHCLRSSSLLMSMSAESMLLMTTSFTMMIYWAWLSRASSSQSHWVANSSN